MRSGDETRHLQYHPSQPSLSFFSLYLPHLPYTTIQCTLNPPILGSAWNMSCFMFVTLNFDPSPTTLGSVWNMRSFVSVL